MAKNAYQTIHVVNRDMISNIIRKSFFAMLVLVTVPIFFGLIVFFWVIGAMTAIFGKLLSMFDDK